jgi:hypothetical protein
VYAQHAAEEPAQARKENYQGPRASSTASPKTNRNHMFMTR